MRHRRRPTHSPSQVTYLCSYEVFEKTLKRRQQSSLPFKFMLIIQNAVLRAIRLVLMDLIATSLLAYALYT